MIFSFSFSLVFPSFLLYFLPKIFSQSIQQQAARNAEERATEVEGMEWLNFIIKHWWEPLQGYKKSKAQADFSKRYFNKTKIYEFEDHLLPNSNR